ncbi:MAG: hypothetical protein PHD48_09595 [Alphaproteobacteria bacterium]|nr:hypothetical protein [Alphaproteobacteria bacterium]
MEYLKIALSALTPILIFIFGLLLLKHTEGVKTKAARQSEYVTKHAEYFFVTYQKLTESLERVLALATICSASSDKGSDRAKNLFEEIFRLYPDISESELRIRRCACFAPINGPIVADIAHQSVCLMAALLSNGGGQDGVLTEKIIELDKAAREAHQEMLEKASTSFWQKLFS